MKPDDFVATSIARRLIARMQATHESRRISVFAGPPGVGKTTAIDEFARRAPGAVAVVKISHRNAKEVLVLQHVLESLRKMGGWPFAQFPNTIWKVREEVFRALCRWADLDPAAVRRGEHLTATIAPLTIVFDEAQNLSRGAIETLRYWNDRDRCYAPFPVGVVFVGNSEFSLRGDIGGESPISAAVADRALYVQTFDYDDVTDDDLRLFLQARGLSEPGAVVQLLQYFRESRTPRSLRRVEDLLEELASVQGETGARSTSVRDVLYAA